VSDCACAAPPTRAIAARAQAVSTLSDFRFMSLSNLYKNFRKNLSTFVTYSPFSLSREIMIFLDEFLLFCCFATLAV
jgi:hypothetical protein